jgi:hypothetical protein
VTDGSLVSSGGFTTVSLESEDIDSTFEEKKAQILSQFSQEDAANVVFDRSGPLQRWIVLSADIIGEWMKQVDAFEANRDLGLGIYPGYILDYSPREFFEDGSSSPDDFFYYV